MVSGVEPSAPSPARAGRAALVLAAGLLLAACPPGRERPGDVDMGTWGLHAEPVARLCDLDEVSGAAFDFQVTLRGDSQSSAAWIVFEYYARDAGWDGAVLSSTATAPRVYSGCDCATYVDETIELALLSASQAAATGEVCPPDALDGGVPAPDADAGLTPPHTVENGFDARLACGRMRTVVRADPTDGGACPAKCDGCTVRYLLTGERR